MKKNLLNYLRRQAFWAMDALKGGKIKKHLDDIEASLSIKSFDLLQEKNSRHLHNLLDVVTSETSYYKNLKNYKSLQDFPVVNKDVIRNNFDELKIKSASKSKLHTIFTSGSTGTPFMVHQTQRKKNRNTADTIYFAQRAGYTLGDKLLYLRMWTKSLQKNKLQAFLQNIEQLNIENLSQNEIQDLLNKLQKDNSPKGWIGYPSGLEKICEYLDSISSKPVNCNINSIIGISENLSDHIRSKMYYYFGAPMVSRYSNTENGIIAQQAINSDHFIINWASYVVEILDFKSDIPVKNGELGRIVITDLFNHATPMIRYDTGDIGSIAIKANHAFPVLERVEGRKSDMLVDTRGNMMSPFKFMSIVPQYPELRQIQFIQTGLSKYTIKINIEQVFQREQELTALFKSYVGKDAEIAIDYVDEIPLLSSKKRKITRNLLLEKEKQKKEKFYAA